MITKYIKFKKELEDKFYEAMGYDVFDKISASLNDTLPNLYDNPDFVLQLQKYAFALLEKEQEIQEEYEMDLSDMLYSESSPLDYNFCTDDEKETFYD